MRQSSQLLALAAVFSTVAAGGVIQGMNVGSTDSSNNFRDQASFQTYFATAKKLAGTDNAYTSARLYTMIQGGTTNTPTSAIPAAIAEGTSLLLGLWTSGDTFNDELAALKSAISQYGSKLGPLVAGISVGSEDLYRNSPTGIVASAGIGQQPDVIVDYIKQVRAAISGTPLQGASVGHVDTWTAWVNGSNAEVIDNCDWLGFDGYPYWQSTDDNTIQNGKSLFLDSYNKVVAVAGSKEVWVTETGWAVSDAQGGQGKAVASTANAKTYYDDVGCGYLFGNVNTYWYMLSDSSATPSFGVTSSDSDATPLYDLSCAGIKSTFGESTTTNSTSDSSSLVATSAAAAISSVSAQASSQLASLSSVMSTATGAAKSSIAAQETSVMAAASAAVSSIVSIATVTNPGSVVSATASSPNSATTTGKNSGAGMNAASAVIVFGAALLAVWLS